MYPQYGWAPDGRSLVIWGEGKIWKVDAASGRGTPIPFTARVEQTLNDALRFPQKVYTDEFPVRMLRDVRVSPDGKSVVYSALGHLYVRALPSGQARRLTKDDRLEFFPSFSRDGQWIVYTTWSDAELGRVRVIRPDGSAGRDIVTRPGHYVEPSFSPDGQTVVFRHAGGDQTRGPFFGEDAGVFVVPVAGGDPLLVRDSGQAPEFDHTGTRVYVREVRNEKNTLLSVGVPAGRTELPGRDEIEHVRSDNATQFAISPDGKWIAFEERYKTYVAPFPRTGRPVDIGPATQAYPVQRVSRDAGFYLHWSADSRRVYWTLGPELYSRDVGETFAFAQPAASAASSMKTEPEAKGIPIGFSAPADKPSGSLALVGARVITMGGLKPGPIQGTPGVIENATVLIESIASRRSGRRLLLPCRPASAASTSAARRSCRGSSTCTGTSPASRAGCSRNRAGRWRRIWPSA